MADTKPFDRPAVREWVAHGLPCALMRAPIDNAINGYVKVPSSFTTDMAAQVEVHGGVTYQSSQWVGFDTLHSGDVWPDAKVCTPSGQQWDKFWDEEMVAEETERLAAEVKRVMEQ